MVISKIYFLIRFYNIVRRPTPMPSFDKNSTLLALFMIKILLCLRILSDIWLSFLPDIFQSWLCFSFKNSFLFFVCILGVLFPSFLLYVFFRISCCQYSVLSNNILQIFIYHRLRIVKDTLLPFYYYSLLW